MTHYKHITLYMQHLSTKSVNVTLVDGKNPSTNATLIKE